MIPDLGRPWRLLTASFTTYTGPGGISIARRDPDILRTTLAGRYPALNPGPWFNSLKNDVVSFSARYRDEVLAPLQPRQVLADLYAIASAAQPGDGPVEIAVLCWEPAGHFCHRRLVGDWFERALPLVVNEWRPPAATAEDEDDCCPPSP